jgi:hypothetical protein
MPDLNLKIDLGHILTLLGMIAMFLIGAGRYSADMEYLKAELASSEQRYRVLIERVVKVEASIENHVAMDKVLRPDDMRQ